MYVLSILAAFFITSSFAGTVMTDEEFDAAVQASVVCEDVSYLAAD